MNLKLILHLVTMETPFLNLPFDRPIIFLLVIDLFRVQSYAELNHWDQLYLDWGKST